MTTAKPEGTEIKPIPCPLCDGEMTKMPSGVWRHKSNVADCLLIDLRFEDDAIPQWNRRPSAPPASVSERAKAARDRSQRDLITPAESAANEIVKELVDSDLQTLSELVPGVAAIISKHFSGVAAAWEPIETAPKDGTEFIGMNIKSPDVMRRCSWEPMDTPLAKYWGISGSFWRKPIKSGKDLLGDWQPTHWIPDVPSPPSGTREGE